MYLSNNRKLLRLLLLYMCYTGLQKTIYIRLCNASQYLTVILFFSSCKVLLSEKNIEKN